MIRARVKEPRTGRMLEIRSQIEAESPEAAYLELQRRIEELRDGTEDPQISIPSFGEYAASLLERQVAKGEIKSASSRQKWAETLEHHLVPRFGRIFVDHVRKQDFEDWLAECGIRSRSSRSSIPRRGTRTQKRSLSSAVIAVVVTILAWLLAGH